LSLLAQCEQAISVMHRCISVKHFNTVQPTRLLFQGCWFGTCARNCTWSLGSVSQMYFTVVIVLDMHITNRCRISYFMSHRTVCVDGSLYSL